jgi:hypothetical protein
MAVTRSDTGDWVGGAWVPDGAASTLSITASVQPVTPELIDMLPEGARTSARFVMYAEAGQVQLITADIGEKRPADRITFQGRDYMLQSIGNWSAHVSGLPHQEYVMIQVGDDE